MNRQSKNNSQLFDFAWTESVTFSPFSVDPTQHFLELAKEIPANPIALYALERTLARNRFSETDFQLDKRLIATARKQLNTTFNQLKQDDIADTVAACLQLEYGYLLPHLERVKYSFATVSWRDIVAGNKEHYNNLDPQVTARVTTHAQQLLLLPLAQGVVRFRPINKFLIIDGYHRLRSMVDLRVEEIPVFVAN